MFIVVWSKMTSRQTGRPDLVSRRTTEVWREVCAWWGVYRCRQSVAFPVSLIKKFSSVGLNSFFFFSLAYLFLCVLSLSVVSNSSWPRGLLSARLLCPWDFPVKITGVACHFLPQEIISTQGLTLSLLSPALAGRLFTTCHPSILTY